MKTKCAWGALLVAACAAGACGGGVDTYQDAAAGDTGRDDAAADASPPDAAADDPAWDGVQPDGPPAWCTMDLVFAVDNSSSMREEISAFRADVWPAFARELLRVSGGLSGSPFRAAVLDACPDPASYHTRGKSGECGFDSGRVWMDSTSGDLAGEFSCVGDIWDDDSACSGDNDDEQPASAAAASFEEAWAGAGKPNEGFLREGALLIVVAITDEDEQPVPGATARQVFDRLAAAKGGDPKKMVFLGIGGGSECEGLYGDARYAQKLKAVTNLFVDQGRGVFWNLCEGRLEDGLAEAMTTIELACTELL